MGYQCAPKSLNRAFILAIALNLAYTAFEGFAALLTSSSSLLADAGHNLVDVMTLVMAFVASLLLARPATQKYTYGLKRLSILAALINSIILFVAIIAIAYDDILSFYAVPSMHSLGVMCVAGLGVVVNGASALLFSDHRAGDLNIKGAFLHLLIDALVSLGVVLGALLIYFTHWYVIDPMLAVVIVVVIVISNWSYFYDCVCASLDAVPRGIEFAEVEAYLMQHNGVKGIHQLRIWALSTQENALTVHLSITKDFANTTLKRIHADLKQKFTISEATIQIETHTRKKGCQTMVN